MRPDARHLAHPLRLGVEHLERALAEGVDDPPGQHRAELADEPRAEVADDVVERRRGPHRDVVGPELRAVYPVDLASGPASTSTSPGCTAGSVPTTATGSRRPRRRSLTTLKPFSGL